MPRYSGRSFDSQNVPCSHWPTARSPLGHERRMHAEGSGHGGLSAEHFNCLEDWRRHASNIAVLSIHVNSTADRDSEPSQIALLYA